MYRSSSARRAPSLVLALVLAHTLLLVPTATGQDGPLGFTGLYVFGDSLSDTSNLAALTDGRLPATSPPYFDGRYSNGPLWVETLATLLRLDVDLDVSVVDDPLASMQAVGGAFTDMRNANAILAPEVAGTGILGQILAFAAADGRIAARDLVIVWGGANDYFGEFGQVDSEPEQVVNNLSRAVEQLTDLGARRFVVPNLPLLGLTPLAQELGLQVPLNALTVTHNLLLERSMRRTAEELGVEILVLDVEQAFLGFDALFDNSLVPCMIQDPPNVPTLTGICPLGPGRIPDSTVGVDTLFVDVIHPTTEAHDLLGALALGSLLEGF